MKQINYSRLLLCSALLILFTAGTSSAQENVKLGSISFFSNYSAAGAKRISVNKANATGGGVTLKFDILGIMTGTFTGGYQLYSIQQDSALARWNWDFWEIRYKNRVKADLAEQPSLSTSLNPVQKMDLFTVGIALGKDFTVFDKLKVTPALGGGMYYYVRRMYVQEDWKKRFESKDYTFEYSYRNYATNKTGNPFFVTGSVELTYPLSEIIGLTGGGVFTQVLTTAGKYGYDQFIFNNSSSYYFSINFNY